MHFCLILPYFSSLCPLAGHGKESRNRIDDCYFSGKIKQRWNYADTVTCGDMRTHALPRWWQNCQIMRNRGTGWGCRGVRLTELQGAWPYIWNHSKPPVTNHACKTSKDEQNSPNAFCCSPDLCPGLNRGKERLHDRLGCQRLPSWTVPSFVEQGVQTFGLSWMLPGSSPVCLPLPLLLLWHREQVSDAHPCCLFKRE